MLRTLSKESSKKTRLFKEWYSSLSQTDKEFYQEWWRKFNSCKRDVVINRKLNEKRPTPQYFTLKGLSLVKEYNKKINIMTKEKINALKKDLYAKYYTPVYNYYLTVNFLDENYGVYDKVLNHLHINYDKMNSLLNELSKLLVPERMEDFYITYYKKLDLITTVRKEVNKDAYTYYKELKDDSSDQAKKTVNNIIEWLI